MIPKVSVIVPIYNLEKYLDQCVQALLAQTLSDIEIILIDDESPDNCPKICYFLGYVVFSVTYINLKKG